MAKTINTRIKLRVDTAANWAAHDTKAKGGVLIYKGEAALSLQSGDDVGKYEIRYGTSDSGSYWSELSSGNFLVPAANVTGLLDALYDWQLTSVTAASGSVTFKLQKKLQSVQSWTDVSTVTLATTTTGTYDASTNPFALKDYVDTAVAGATTQYFESVRSTVTPQGETERPETDDEVINRYFTEHPGITVKGGSTFVIKTAIGSTGKYEYIAFTYDTTTDSENPVWRAMDGNYNAENVYFANDFTLAGNWGTGGQVGNVKLSSKTLSAAGKSVKQLFETIFDQTVQPTMGSAPSTTVTLTNSGSYEIGTFITPSYTTSFTQGKYNTPWNNSSVADGTASTGVSISDNANPAETSTSASGTFTAIVVSDFQKFKRGSTTVNSKYKLTANHTYNAGSIAKDNKGNNSNPIVQRSAGTTSTASSLEISGFRYGFIYGTSETAVTSAEVTSAMLRGSGFTRDTSKRVTSNSVSFTEYTVELPAGATLVIAAIGNRTLSYAYNNTAYAEMTSAFNVTRRENVSVQGADLTDTYATNYTVWTYTPQYAYTKPVSLTLTIS